MSAFDTVFQAVQRNNDSANEGIRAKEKDSPQQSETDVGMLQNVAQVPVVFMCGSRYVDSIPWTAEPILDMPLGKTVR